jgi:hypothetical protein
MAFIFSVEIERRNPQARNQGEQMTADFSYIASNGRMKVE